jgi:hypothetical protein
MGWQDAVCGGHHRQEPRELRNAELEGVRAAAAKRTEEDHARHGDPERVPDVEAALDRRQRDIHDEEVEDDHERAGEQNRKRHESV